MHGEQEPHHHHHPPSPPPRHRLNNMAARVPPTQHPLGLERGEWRLAIVAVVVNRGQQRGEHMGAVVGRFDHRDHRRWRRA